MNKKMNALTLSGLMIGPILGSGILFLPPLAYKMMGKQSIFAWVIIMVLGTLFAYVFVRMGSFAPDDRGLSAIIGMVLGKKFESLSSNYLTAAVIFGPVAVAVTAAEFIRSFFSGASNLLCLIAAFVVLILSTLLILSDVTFMSKIMLLLSSTIAILLLCGSFATLMNVSQSYFAADMPEFKELGQTLLLIFWAIVGWEVLGNYTEDIDDSRRTMMRAMKLSIVVILLVYISSVLAVQAIGAVSMSDLLKPIFGVYSNTVFGFLAVGLCICTIVTFMGAVVRQLTVRAQGSLAFRFLQKKQTASAVLLIADSIVLLGYAFHLLTLQNIIEAANILFIGNAFLGLIAGLKLIKNLIFKLGIIFLLIMMLAILVFSPLYSIVLLALVTLLSLFLTANKEKSKITN